MEIKIVCLFLTFSLVARAFKFLLNGQIYTETHESCGNEENSRTSKSFESFLPQIIFQLTGTMTSLYRRRS